MPISIPSIDIPNAIQKLERRNLDDNTVPAQPYCTESEHAGTI